MTTHCESVGINFTDLCEEWELFPFCCINGYYFLWNVRLPAAKIEEPQNKPETLLRNEIARIKKGENPCP
jgi:hypothetical protein